MNVPPDFPLTLNLPAKDVHLLLHGTGHLAYNVVAGVIQNVEQQIQAQLAVHAAASKELGDRKGVAPPIAGPSE